MDDADILLCIVVRSIALKDIGSLARELGISGKVLRAGLRRLVECRLVKLYRSTIAFRGVHHMRYRANEDALRSMGQTWMGVVNALRADGQRRAQLADDRTRDGRRSVWSRVLRPVV